MGAVNRERHDAKRWSILDAALRFLRERSVREFRVVDVAKMAGVSKPAVYYYFDDDEALLVEAYRELVVNETTLLFELSKSGSNNETLLPLLRDIEARVGRVEVAEHCAVELAGYWTAYRAAIARNALNGYVDQLLPPNKDASAEAQQ